MEPEVRYVTVAKLGEVLPGQTHMVSLGKCQILVVNDGGVFYALQGMCGHQNLPLAGGKVWRGVLDCPWHHFQYDIQTGENVYPRRVYPLSLLPQLQQQVSPLVTYPVRVVAAVVQVGIPAGCLDGEAVNYSTTDKS